MNKELNIGQLNWDIKQNRLDRLCKKAWQRLPEVVKSAASYRLRTVYDVDEWSEQNKRQLTVNGELLWSAAKFSPTFGEICISQKDCQNVSDDVIVGAFIHEVAHAFQTQITASNLDAIEYAGDALPAGWCFAKELAAMILERAKRNPCTFQSNCMCSYHSNSAR